MKVKIDEKLICIPPYISTTWDQITFLQSEEDPEAQLFTLIIHMPEGRSVRIPKLDASLIDIAFSAHMNFLERNGSFPKSKGEGDGRSMNGLLQQLIGLSPEQLANIPIRFGIAGIEGMPGMEVLQHNVSHANTADLPSEMLEKISSVIKMMTNDDVNGFPKPEPHCNCPHCQVARAIHQPGKKRDPSELDQPVSEEDLKFRDWEIVKKGEMLYVVTNPLNPREHYSVYLGTPVGCTCGENHCEHIKAVLYS